MSLETSLQILQAGFSGFVFLMAYLSCNLIREEQSRDAEPREKILSEVRSFRAWALFAAILVLAGISGVRAELTSAILCSLQRQFEESRAMNGKIIESVFGWRTSACYTARQ
jgi:hypothetical protein